MTEPSPSGRFSGRLSWITCEMRRLSWQLSSDDGRQPGEAAPLLWRGDQA